MDSATPAPHRLWIGMGGYSFSDWIGLIYPPGTPPKDYLGEYAKYFPFVELNFTYYRMPSARTMAGMLTRAPRMRFAVKANDRFTHMRSAGKEAFEEYRAGIAPLIEADALLAVLLQFPHSFHQSAQNRAWIEYLREGFPDLPLVAEFRSAEWVNKEVTRFLAGLDIGWCAVDEPPLPELMPPAAAVTGPVSYVRFHGRNSAQWWDHEEAWERHDYLYTPAELEAWIPKLEQMVAQSEVTAVAFNNTCWGQGIENAQMLLDLLPASLKAHTIVLDPPRRIETRYSRPQAIAAHRAKRAAAAASQATPQRPTDQNDLQLPFDPS